jgi:type I restriction enzyme S subunit
MNTEEKKTLVPMLRFPEFRGSEEWSKQHLGSVAKFFKGKGLPKSALALDGKRPCIHYGELFTFYSEVIDVVRSRTNSEDDLFLSFKNDVLMPTSDVTPSGLAKACCLNSEGVILGGDILVIRTDKNSVNGEFLARQIRYLEHKVLQLVSGSTVFHLYASSMEKLALSFPSKFAEQKKIADCLSSLDELIAAQARKVEALKTHKKGLMQQLFPREGETLPSLRFPKFRDTGEWEIRELSEFIIERNEYPTDKVPLFSLTIEDGVTPKTERYERSFLVNDEADAYKLVLPNDFAFNPMNLRFGAIGRHSGTEKVAVSRYYNIFSCAETVDSSFCETYFRSERMVAFYDERAIGSLIEKRRVHFSAFLKFNIRFPLLPEQQCIADCLSSLDALIAASTQELDVLKTHKRGLMQQLFQSLEVVNA